MPSVSVLRRSLVSLSLMGWMAGCAGAPEAREVTPDVSAFVPVPFVPSQAILGTSGFSDESGGGVFLGAQGNVIRLRADGTLGALESHPENPVSPGADPRIFPFGPHAALVDTRNGTFLATDGWLVVPPWQSSIAAQSVRAAAITQQGVGWIASDSGVFRNQDGQLSALTAPGFAFDDVKSLVVAPAPDFQQESLYLLAGDGLVEVRPNPKGGIWVAPVVLPSGVSSDELVGLASTGMAPEGALWVLAQQRLFRFGREGWTRWVLPSRAMRVVGRGEWLFVQSETEIYRYDAFEDHWSSLSGTSSADVIVDADASGALWLQRDGQVRMLSEGPSLRVKGLDQSSVVVVDASLVEAVLATTPEPPTVVYSIDGEPFVSVEGPAYHLGGRSTDGSAKRLAFTRLSDGPHVLTVEARLKDVLWARRRVPFTFRPLFAAPRFAEDVWPIFESRCAHCHTQGPGRDLSNQSLWETNAEAIASAVTERRMPADGPLDSDLVAVISRWAAARGQP